jgi:hypothetical protein
MSVISKIILNWHTFRVHYHELLLDSCLCEKIKAKLYTKIHYHRNKINEIKFLSTPF